MNVTGNTVTLKGVEQLKDIKDLTHLYIYQTGILASDTDVMKKLFPRATIDVGGYTIPFLASDTAEVKPPEKNK